VKLRIATALSISGVMIAASAAALANTLVLNAPDRVDAGGVLTAPAADRRAGSSLAPAAPTSAAPAASVLSVPTATTAASTLGAPATQSSYQVDDVGLVVVDAADGGLAVVSAVPNGEWQVVSSGSPGPGLVRVVFRSAGSDVTFDATLNGGQVSASIEVRSVVAARPPETSVLAPSSTVGATTPDVGSDDTGADGRRSDKPDDKRDEDKEGDEKKKDDKGDHDRREDDD
jgi:hypothetical protein